MDKGAVAFGTEEPSGTGGKVEVESLNRTMDIRSVTYLAIILAGFFVGQIFPLAEMIGVGPSTLFMALFLPHFRWRKTLGISVFLTTIAVLLYNIIPFYYTYMQNVCVNLSKTVKEQNINVDFVQSSYLPIALTLGTVSVTYIGKFFLIFSTHKMLVKTGVYRIFSF